MCVYVYACVYVSVCACVCVCICVYVYVWVCECSGYDTTQSDGEVPVMLELWGMPNIPLLPQLPGLLWPGAVAPDKAIYVGKIELNCELFERGLIWFGLVWFGRV